MFCYEAVCAYLNMFNTYSNVNWDCLQKMRTKSREEITNTVFRNWKIRKRIILTCFSPVWFISGRKRACSRKKIKYTSQVCQYLEWRKMSLSMSHQTTSCLSQCSAYHHLTTIRGKKYSSLPYMYTISMKDVIRRMQ